MSPFEFRFLHRDNLDEFVAAFIAAPRFSFDTETTGLLPNAPGGRIRTLQIAMDSGTWIIRLYMAVTSMSRHETQYNFLKWLEESSRGKWCAAQNGKFDNQWLLKQYGVSFHLNFDTSLAHHLLDENSPHGLKEMAQKYLGAPDYDLPLAHLMNPEKHNALDRFYDYSARDAHYTLQLAILFDGMLKKDRTLRRIFYKLVMPAARAFTFLELNGITLDMDKFESTEIDVRQRRDASETQLNRMAALAGAEGINWGSPQQVSKFLYGTLKIEPTVFTDSGAASTGEEALMYIKDQHPIAGKLVEFRELSKFLNTYLEGWREYIVGNKIYFSTKLHGTVTGRYSSRLHQVPRDGTIRNLAVAPPHYSFVQADLSQAEVRMVAEVSRDAELLLCFKRGIDVHWRTLMFAIQSGGNGDYLDPLFRTASTLAMEHVDDIDRAAEIMMEFGHEKAISYWPGWKEGRKKAKGIVFGFLYGMGAKSFVDYAKLKYGFEPTLEESITLRNAFFHLYRGLEPWHEKQRALVRRNGQVHNLIGRVRRLPEIYWKDKFRSGQAERQAINSPIQGFIGDLKAMALVEIHETLPPWSVRVVGEVHDSILLNVRTEELDVQLPKIRAIMRHPKLLDTFNVKLTVPIEADLEVGPWGKGRTYKKDLESTHGS